ncbi:MAG: hypothetical protein WCX21_08360 [Bacteroidales bacterium]
MYQGSWQIDTSRVNVSITIDAGDASKLQQFIPFITENYQDIRLLIKEPSTIIVSATSSEDPYSGNYTLVFSSGITRTGGYKLAGNILYLKLSDNYGRSYTIPCQADGSSMQIFYSTPYMKAVLLDFIEKHYPQHTDLISSVLSGIVFSIEGLGFYNTRTRGSDGQYEQ